MFYHVRGGSVLIFRLENSCPTRESNPGLLDESTSVLASRHRGVCVQDVGKFSGNSKLNLLEYLGKDSGMKPTRVGMLKKFPQRPQKPKNLKPHRVGYR